MLSADLIAYPSRIDNSSLPAVEKLARGLAKLSVSTADDGVPARAVAALVVALVVPISVLDMADNCPNVTSGAMLVPATCAFRAVDV
jgi:hypothetical protein